MLQYLLNISIIWLTCLLCYEMLFRKETFHRFNRGYLLISIIVGLLLPVLQLNYLWPRPVTTFARPLQVLYEVGNNAEAASKGLIAGTHTAASIATEVISFGDLLICIYLLGVAIGFLVILSEAISLYRLYKKGITASEHGNTIVETNADHSPFSFFGMIFISDRRYYNKTQWHLLIAHEQEHISQRHSLDNLLLVILRVIFWFHPLVHIYYKRLRMIHEFQADDAAAKDLREYGSFLLEQNMMQETALLIHSFNYSPIKTRIAMLTKEKSTKVKMLKYTIAMPLLAALAFCCTQVSVAGKITAQGNKVYFKGNEIEFGKLKIIPYSYREQLKKQQTMFLYPSLPDSIPAKDLLTGNPKMEPVQSDMMPVAYNGKRVLGNESKYLLPEAEMKFTAPVFSATAKSFEEYLFENLQKEFSKLDNGEYSFNVERVVLDEKGKIGYYEANGISVYSAPYEQERIINAALKHAIDKKIVNLLEASEGFKPAMKDNRPVNVRVNTGTYEVIVKNHIAKLTERGGC